MKKYSLMLIIVAAILLEVMGAAQYFLAQRGTRDELLVKAQRDMDQSQRVAMVKAEVESAVRNIHGEAERAIGDPNRYYVIATQIVKNNPHIVGAGIAFRPYYYKDRGNDGLFAPYCYDEQPDVTLKKKKTGAPQTRATLLPFDYTDREWFNKPLADGKSLWTAPYVDQGGTHIIMCTYVMPIRDKKGEAVGVFFADVPMEDVSLLSINIQEGITQSRVILFAIQIASLFIIGIIVWLAFKAFSKYKEQVVDPEKEQLVKHNEKLRHVNRRLTERNLDLAKKLEALRSQLPDANV
jgi:uncharacterized protein YpmB